MFWMIDFSFLFRWIFHEKKQTKKKLKKSNFFIQTKEEKFESSEKIWIYYFYGLFVFEINLQVFSDTEKLNKTWGLLKEAKLY